MKRKEIWQKVLAILIATIVLVFGSVLVFNTVQRSSGQQAVSAIDISVTSTPSPTMATDMAQDDTALATEVPLPATMQTETIPVCVFSDTAISETSAGVTFDAYVFSEPQVVLTSSTALGIAGWLPDNERLLLTRHAPNGRQLIETLNIRSGERQVYAERQGANGKPLWIASLNAVAYATSVDGHQELWLSSGDPQSATSIVPDVAGLSLATDSTQLVYFSPAVSGDQPYIWNAARQTKQALSLELGEQLTQVKTEAMSSDNNRLTPGRTFHAAWQPGGTKLAFYGHTWLILFDQQTQQTCQVNLEQLDGKAHSILHAWWSPDGRYLALSGSLYFSGIAPTNKDLIILDTLNGELYQIDFQATYVSDIAWAPDSQTMALLRTNEEHLKLGRIQLELFVLNVLDGRLERVASQYTFGNTDAGWQMPWSPDGNYIAVECPVWPTAEQKWITEDRICLINVSLNMRSE